MNEKEIRERFYNEFGEKGDWDGIYVSSAVSSIADFFLAEMKTERERVVRLAEGMKKMYRDEPPASGDSNLFFRILGYNQALSDFVRHYQNP